MHINLRYFGNRVTEETPFEINRPEGSSRYIFFHFISPVEMQIDNQVIQGNPGNCILYTPKTKQYFRAVRNRLNHDYLDFTLDDENFFREIGFPVNEIFNPFLSNNINNLFVKINEEKKSGKLDSKYLISSYLIEFFIEIARKLKRGRKTVSNDEELKIKFENLRLALYQSPKDYSVSEMADSFHYSLPYFNILYKKFLEISPIDDLNLARIEYIEKNPNCLSKIKDVVNELGFFSDEYFYRWFKKNFKMTPKEYKNLN
ncbi:MAG: AraC family transcriptional regulator [Bacillales bacterium]|jgi:AraC-like DNA-binding protein|nr:AraC family transcriptional regulator [Bacillales bacterium]